MAAIAIRRADPDDAEALAHLGELTFRETFLEDFAIPYPPDDLAAFVRDHYAPQSLRARLADPRGAWWLAEDDGSAIAYAAAGPCALPHPQAREDDPELQRLYVRRRDRGRAIGSRLLTVALGWMDAAAPAMQWLGVWSGNLKAQRLYAAHGFERVGGYEFAVGRWRDAEFILRRSPRAPISSADGEDLDD